jgi:hypothetical protein
LSDGGLMLEDAATAVGSIEPLARFGSSAFGPIRVRAITADGAASDWQPLGTLVRLPGFTSLRCPRAAAKPCLLSGTNLFLASSFSAASTFDNSTDVPPEFAGTELIVPHPVNGTLYVKLRDDPATVQALSLPVTTLVAPAGAQAHAGMPPALAPAVVPEGGPVNSNPPTSAEPAAPSAPQSPPAADTSSGSPKQNTN